MTTYYERQTTLTALVTAKGEDDAGLEFDAIVTAFANLNADLLTAIAAAAGGSDALHKFDATADPTVDDDSGDGYSPGSRWINTSTPAAFICLDASAGAAVWTSLAPVEVSSAEAAAGTETGIRGWSPAKVKHAIDNLAGSATVSIDDTDSVYTIIAGNLSPVRHTILVDISAGNVDIKELALANMSGNVRVVIQTDDGTGATYRCRLLDSASSEVWTGHLEGDFVEFYYDGTTRILLDERFTAEVDLRLTADDAIAATTTEKIFDAGYNVKKNKGGYWDSATNHRMDLPAFAMQLDVRGTLFQSNPGRQAYLIPYINGTPHIDAAASSTTSNGPAVSGYAWLIDAPASATLEFYARRAGSDGGNIMGDAAEDETMVTVKVRRVR